MERWIGSCRRELLDRTLIWNTALVETLEFDNLVGQASVTVAGALNRQ